MSELTTRTQETPEETKTRFLLEHPLETTYEEWLEYYRLRNEARENGHTVWMTDGKKTPRYTLWEGSKEAYLIEEGLEGWGVYFPSPESGLAVLEHAANVSLGEAIQAVEAASPPTFPLIQAHA